MLQLACTAHYVVPTYLYVVSTYRVTQLCVQHGV